MIPVGGLFGVMPKSTIEITVYEPPTRNLQGHAVPGTETTTSESVPVHPATSRAMLERLPVEDRSRETLAIYVRASSALAPPVSRSSPPTIAYRGESYTVMHSGDYATQGGVYLVLAQRQNR